MPQASSTIVAQALDFGPALFLNLGFVVLTGWLLWMRFGGLLGDTPRRLTILTIIGLFGLGFVGCLSLSLAMASWFSTGHFFGAWALMMALLAWDAWRRDRWRMSLSQWRSAELLPAWILPLFLLWFLLYTRPFDLVTGGRDPGVYVNTAAQIAEQGGIAVAAPFFASLEPAVQDQLLWTPYWLLDFIPYKWPGFFWIDSTGIILPQFFHMYPALMAPSYTILGYKGALTILPVVILIWGLLLAEMTWFLWLPRRQIASEPAGAAPSTSILQFGSILPPLFLLLNPAMFWFGRFANADVPYGLFVFAALFFWARAAEAGNRGWFNWPLAQLYFGAALLTKIDSLYLLPGAVVTAQIFHPARHDSGRWARWAAWGAVCGFYLAAVYGFSYPYILSTLRALEFEVSGSREMAVLIAAGYLAIVTVAGLLPPLLAPGRLERWRERWRLPGMSLPLTVGAACLSSLLVIGVLFSGPAGPTAALDVLLAYVPGPMLLAGLAGIVLLVLRVRERALALSLLAIFFSSGLYRLLQTSAADHPWNERRATSVALPLLLLCSGLAVAEVARWAGTLKDKSSLSRTAWWLLPLAAVVAVLAPMVRPIPSIFQHQEAAGAREQLHMLDSLFPKNAVILSGGTQAIDLFGPGLRARSGREIISFYGSPDEPMADAELVERIGDAAFVAERPFFVVIEGDDPPPGHFLWARAWWDEWTLSRMVSKDSPGPLVREDVLVRYRIYQTLGVAPAEAQPQPQVRLYEAEALPSQIGRVVEDNTASNGWAREAESERDPSGALIYGPYAELPTGSYVARFWLRVTGDTSLSPSYLLVSGTGNHQLALQRLDTPMTSYQDLELPFTLEGPDKVEFSLIFNDVGRIWLDKVEVAPLVQTR